MNTNTGDHVGLAVRPTSLLLNGSGADTALRSEAPQPILTAETIQSWEKVGLGVG